jgi:hypothetical protein
MKTIFCVAAIVGLGIANSRGEIACEPVQQIVSSPCNAPVVNSGSVVYQAGVVYNAPVVYNNNAPSPVVYAPVEYVCPAPNVIITGGRNAGAYYTSYETSPNVIIIGRSANCQPQVSTRHRSFRR